jgi:hypothetical protein
MNTLKGVDHLFDIIGITNSKTFKELMFLVVVANERIGALKFLEIGYTIVKIFILRL